MQVRRQVGEHHGHAVPRQRLIFQSAGLELDYLGDAPLTAYQPSFFFCSDQR
jgi:hypothetical protein